MGLEDKFADNFSISGVLDRVKSTLHKTVDALNQTRDDYTLINKSFQEVKRDTRGYYERKKIKNMEMGTLLFLPVQFMSRLVGRDFYGLLY